MERAFLFGTDLRGASLNAVNFKGAVLCEAIMEHALLGNTDLSGANLSGVKGLTQAQIDHAEADFDNPPESRGRRRRQYR